MIDAKESVGNYVSAFAELENRLGSDPRPAVRDLRRAAIGRFTEFGFPTTRNEQWRFTNVAPLANVRFASSATPTPVIQDIDVRLLPFADLGIATRLVFINGRVNRQLSTDGDLPPQVLVLSLEDALRDERIPVEEYLGRFASFARPEEAFTALNTAFIEDGALVWVPRGVVLEQPIHLLFISTTEGEPRIANPRNLIVVERESQAKIVEGYVTLGAGAAFTNTVTELCAGEGAIVEHYRLQQESLASYHVSNLRVEQGRSSNVVCHSVALGGALVRNDVTAVMDGEGGECTLNGLYLATGTQHIDNHTMLDHAKAHCSSREYYKGVLDGKASGVFNGGITVRPDAQKTDAIQSNKNMLLSEDAVINTKPQLEIWADDVRCTHGATIGQLDSEAIFYLQARGIGRDEARHLLTYAFANDVIGRMTFAGLRDLLEKALYERLA